MTQISSTTIAAQATPPGRGGIGVIRLSGPEALSIAQRLVRRSQPLRPRHAHFLSFYTDDQWVIDQGLALYFPAPNSFTGEDVVEIQGHGGPAVMAALLQRVLQLGAQLARPGEFSERAFLNDKMDLAQAEAIADLIDASSEQAARSAMRSLQGAFSQRIHQFSEQLTQLRLYVEAAIDFPEEEVDFLADGKIQSQLESLIAELAAVKSEARQGVLLQEGMKVVLAGKPNAGKSSLLNALSGRDSAIVTPIAGTTRDLVREHIHIDGMPLHVIDTAGVRTSEDPIEQEGIRRTWNEIQQADLVILLVDAQQLATQQLEIKSLAPETLWPEFFAQLSNDVPVILVLNKIDLLQAEPEFVSESVPLIALSAKTGAGVSLLRQQLKSQMGFAEESEGTFTARQRHLDAISQANGALERGLQQLVTQGAGELLAEDLRLAQDTLAEITGRVTPDDLLGKIFSSFCIGK